MNKLALFLPPDNVYTVNRDRYELVQVSDWELYLPIPALIRTQGRIQRGDHVRGTHRYMAYIRRINHAVQRKEGDP